MSSHETTSGDSVSKKSTDQPQPDNRYDDVRAGQTAPMDRAAGTTQQSATSQDSGEEEVLILGTQSNQAEMKEFMALTGSVKLFKNQKIHETKMIYKGEKTTVGESVPVVVKLMENTKEALREAKSLHSIEVHPNVVRIYDSGVNDKDMNLIYIVMELCSEETLNNYINQNDFNLQLAIRHCTQIIDGLCYIHSKKIVHRDLKPDNILFSLKDGHNQVKITDFGVSKNYITDPQATSKPFGTMGYVAPEIITSEKPSDPTKCDIFSLGVLLAFILSNGKHPYGDEPWQWNFNIAAGKDPNLNEILVPEGGQRDAVFSIILSMLQRNPDDRPTADDALKMWLRDVDLEGDVNFRHQPKRRRIDGPKSIQTPCIIGVTQQDKEFNECNELICWNSIEEMEYDPMIALDMPEVGSLSYTIYGHVRVFYLLASDLSCRKLDLDDASKGLIKLDSMKHDHGLRPHATFLNGKLYVCGSRRNQGGQISKKCEVFDGQWSEIADLNMARNLNTVVSYDGCLYSVGGLDEEGNPLSSVEKYDPAKNTWVFITSLNVARRGPYAIVYNGKMHVLCGTDENGKVWIPSFERFDPSTSMWTVFTSSWWKNNKPVFPFIFDNKVFSVSYDDAPGYRNIQQVPLNNEAEEDLIKVQLPRRSKLYRITSAV